MTWNSSGNGILKEWGEVKIIENEHIYKNLVSSLVGFVIPLEFYVYFSTMDFLKYVWLFCNIMKERVNEESGNHRTVVWK